MWSDKTHKHDDHSCFAAVPHDCFPGNGHDLPQLSQCDNQHAKAALLQHPQEMEIQSVSAVCLCVKPISLSDEPLSAGRRAEAESAPPVLRFRGGWEGGEHFRHHIWRCWILLSPPPQRDGANPSLFASRSARTTGKADEEVVGESEEVTGGRG